ncbi:hypothetical protein VP1G_02402 [Cytospora mali]|uniref:DUF7730 domain-containing protein n=1 Tax=Cytospora mali TaxID=578113 RepID=A0A194UTW3_CYTMA|nr:hypothetical protein VP1G_02402 [Valsa mali var. pyri (nom. inval.)]
MVCSFRDRKIRNGLHNSFPPEGSPEARRYDMNRQVSPLLRIPIELRLQIYELVLGDRQIHVFYVPWQHKRRIKNGQAYTETIKGGFRYEVLHKKQDPWALEPKQLRKSAALPPASLGTRITLLSGVCRQLYHETSLLPQQMNTWSFENLHVMERYILKENRMPLMQRRAAQTLYCKEKLPKALEKKFGGLKAIIWKDGKKLRRQDLLLYPEIAWKDRTELRERSCRW